MVLQEKVIEDFPILEREIHGKKLVYLDNAATTLRQKHMQCKKKQTLCFLLPTLCKTTEDVDNNLMKTPSEECQHQMTMTTS